LQSQAITQKNTAILKSLFINMHTIKGAARSLYLKKLAQVLHESEQYFTHLQAHPAETWDIQKMSQQLQEVDHRLAQYERIARDKLGRNMEQIRFADFHLDQIRALYDKLKETSQGPIRPQSAALILREVKDLFHQKLFREAQVVVQEQLECLSMLAKDLHKEIPKVQVETHGILFSERAEDLFRKAFVHVLRNSMDHGIETASERLRQGKNPQGNIHIEMRRDAEQMIMTLNDDGRGLPIHKIKQIGLARGLLQAEDQDDRDRVAHLIFHAGLSTTNRLTEISGRGIGMNAVKKFIEEAGGTIEIQWQREDDPSQSHCLFLLVISLPFSRLFELEGTEIVSAA